MKRYTSDFFASLRYKKFKPGTKLHQTQVRWRFLWKENRFMTENMSARPSRK